MDWLKEHELMSEVERFINECEGNSGLLTMEEKVAHIDNIKKILDAPDQKSKD